MKHSQRFVLAGCLIALAMFVQEGFGQTGTVRGRVTDKKTGEPLPAVNVLVRGTTMGASSNTNGEYQVINVSPGTYTLVATLVGYERQEISGVVVAAGATVTRNIEMVDASVTLGEMTVFGASKRAERITEAPAAISSLSPLELRLNSAHGQLPRLLENEPGVDIVQSGIHDFNINTRGFNSSLNRRLLVLLDGRDLAIAFLGAQEWNGLSMPLADISRLELVRGPGSALYGPNAFNGVINITTPSPREVQGTQASVSAGELSLFRADVRHAGVIGDRWSYKANAGRVQSQTWSQSRVTPPFEYPGLSAEAIPLDRGDVVSSYMSGRIDHDYIHGGVATVEAGITEVENEVFVTGIGRVQVRKAHKPWGRLNYASERLNIMLWAQGRKTQIPQYSLVSGLALQEKSQIYNSEVQYNFAALQDRVRIIVGGSHRIFNVDTEGTLMAEKKNDNTSGLFGQVEYSPIQPLKFVGAARWDRSTLHESEFSPKAGVVWTPMENHSFRATFNRAFQVPNYSEFFLQVDVAQPTASPRQLESGLEQYFAAVRASLPAPLVDPLNLPVNLPWEFSALTRVQALGNNKLGVEHIQGFEAGYKGVFLNNRLFVTLDAYFNRLEDFITDLLPGVNPAYPSYSLRDQGTDIPKNLNDLDALYNQLNLPAAHPLRQNLAALRAGYNQLAAQLGPLLATLPNGQRGGVLSYTNAGKVDETGTELGVSFYATQQVLLKGTWTWYDFKVKEQQRGDVLLPNAPKHKFSFGATYLSPFGLEADVTARNVQPFRWAAGIFEGQIPAYTLVNFSAGYQASANYRFGLVISNLFNHQVYQIFGGSLIGRQAIGTLTFTI
jgi:outer membrane receptor for ferrienterochelin and colicins